VRNQRRVVCHRRARDAGRARVNKSGLHHCKSDLQGAMANRRRSGALRGVDFPSPGPSAVSQYARRFPRHCAQCAAVYAVPQYTAVSYTMLLNLGMVSIERFLCGHSDSTKQDFSQKKISHYISERNTIKQQYMLTILYYNGYT